MKRILSLILVAVLCLAVLTSCEQVGGIWDNVTGTVGGWLGIETPEEDTGLSAADVYLHNLYGKKDGSSVTNDFDVVGRVPAGDGKFLNVAWTCDDDSIVIRESTTAGFYTVDLPATNAEEFDFTLTATITDEKGETKTRSYTFTMLKVDNSVIVTEPVEGVAYKLFLTQGTIGKRLYALNTQQLGTGAGASKGKYIKTTTVPQDGVEFFAEKVDGGYKLYTIVNDVKNYIRAEYFAESEGKNPSKYIGFSTEDGSVLTYNGDLGGVWTVTIDGNTFGIGTYGSYDTICISDASFFSTSSVGSSQFVMQIVTAEYANSQTEDADLPTYKDAAEILNLLYALEDGKTMAGNFYLTGKITALDSYGNPTIVVEGFEDKPVLCYKLTDDRFVEGATISVYAKVLKNYKGTYELEQCEVKSFLAPSEGGDTTDTYGVVTEIKNGDHVLIGNPANGKLLSANKTGYYNIGVDYTADNFSQVTDAEIWVVTVNDDGSYSFTSLTGEKLGMADEFSSFNSAGPNFGWALEAKEGANGIFYIKNTVRGNYIEWYADKGNWSSYTNPNSDLYELAFYVKGATGNVGGDDPVTPPAGNEDAKAILDALYALQDNESLTGPFTLTGKITALDSYKNPTIVVEGYENMPVYCYKLVVDNAVGDVITVTAKSMKNYKGTYVFMDCTLVENGNQGGTDDPVTPPAGTDDPKTVLDTLYGLAAGESLEGSFTLTGTITKLNYQKYPTIVVEGYEDMPVYCYKLVVTGEVGDVITVTATTLTNYNGTYEFMNCTLVHDCVYAEATCTVVELCTICGAEKPGSTTLPHTWIDATCTVPKTCSVCGGVEGNTIAHTFVNGVCSCGVSESDKKASVNIGDYAAANGWTNAVMQNTITANGDITITATSTNANVSYGNNTGKYYSSDFTWRIYQADGPQVTISGIEGVTIKYIQIAYVAKNEGTLAIGETFVEDYALVAVNANSVTLTVINDGSGTKTNGQALITGIVVYYEGGNAEAPVQPETPVEPDDGLTTIPEALEAADGTEVVVKGVVISTDAWNTEHNNMSVTIKDEDGNTLYIYRLGTQVGLGDTITVTGTMATYYENRQIAQGATAVINVVHGDDHTYENGVCTVCGTAKPVAGTTVVDCDFSTLAKGTQYADESNTFGGVTVSTHNKGCHFNTQLRIYDSSTNNGYATVDTNGKVISSLTVNAGYKSASLEVYGSTDGETWVLIDTISTATAYANYTLAIDASLGYTYLKLDAVGAQVRVASLSVTIAQ